MFSVVSRFLKHQREIEKRAARGNDSTSLAMGVFNFRAVSGLDRKRSTWNTWALLSAPLSPQIHNVSMSQRVGAFSMICCEAVRSARRIAPATDTWQGNVASTPSSGGRVARGTSASWPSKRRWIEEDRERWGMIEMDQVTNVSGFEQGQPTGTSAHTELFEVLNNFRSWTMTCWGWSPAQTFCCDYFWIEHAQTVCQRFFIDWAWWSFWALLKMLQLVHSEVCGKLLKAGQGSGAFLSVFFVYRPKPCNRDRRPLQMGRHVLPNGKIGKCEIHSLSAERSCFL